MAHDLHWDDLKVALAIGRAGSLNRAGEALGMDQSTVGRRLTTLESALGATLFLRSRRGLRPTAAGEIAIRWALEMEARADTLGQELAAAEKGVAGVMLLLSNGWLLERLADRALGDLVAAHPYLELCMLTQRPGLLRGRDASAGLWFDARPGEDEFAIKLADVPYGVYAAADSDPGAQNWVQFHDPDGARPAATRTVERLRGDNERIVFSANDAAMLQLAVRSGVGKGLLPYCLAEEDPGLVRVNPGPPELVRGLHVHLHPDSVQLRRVQAVIRWLREVVPTTLLAKR
ncbi:MAG: LysR family transcriptional regulator [Pseudomonadota bacterium]